MRPIRLHNRPLILARLFCLVLMVALLANPVLAVVSTSTDCSGTCCCCADTGPEPTVKISGNSDMNSDCCNPAGSIPCRMTTDSLPDAPLALIQTTQWVPHDSIPMLMSGSNAAMSVRSNQRSISKRVTGTTLPTPLLYLQSCRLIC